MPYLAPFLRYGDLLAENRQFSLFPSHFAPLLGMIPFEFMEKINGS